MAAIKALNISHPCDALALLRELRLEAASASKPVGATGCISSLSKTQQSATVEGSGADADNFTLSIQEQQ